MLVASPSFTDKVSTLAIGIAYVLVFFGGILLVVALCNLATSSGNSSSREQQQPDNQSTLHLTSNTKSKNARCSAASTSTMRCARRVELHRSDAIDVLSFTYQRQERVLCANSSQQQCENNENVS